MDNNELIQALCRLKVQTGSLACLGCGYEHSCSVHGCAILRAAAERLKNPWDGYEDLKQHLRDQNLPPEEYDRQLRDYLRERNL